MRLTKPDGTTETLHEWEVRYSAEQRSALLSKIFDARNLIRKWDETKDWSFGPGIDRKEVQRADRALTRALDILGALIPPGPR